MNAFPQKPTVRAPIVAPATSTAPGPGIPTSHPLAAILDTLHRGERFLVCSHTRPDGDGIGAGLDQLARQSKGGRTHVAVTESSRIGEDRRVKTLRHRRREANACGPRQLIHHLPHTRGAMIDPVEMRKFAAGQVVVDIDHEEFFEPAQPRSFQAVALQQKRRIVGSANARHGLDGVGTRHLPVLDWNTIGRYQIGGFAHLLDHHPQRQHRAHGITIGTHMRTD